MSISKLFDGYNAGYAQELYERYARNPESVSAPWREIFARNLEELVAEGLITPDAFQSNGQLATRLPALGEDASSVPSPGADVGSGRRAGAQGRLVPRIARASALIQAFRDHGHQLARIDPLGSDPPGHPQLAPAFFGTSMEDLEAIPTSLVLEDGGDQPLSETLQRLRDIYCGSIGYQFEHLEDPVKVRWLWNEVESGRHSEPLDPEGKLRLLKRLVQVEGMERFLHRAYLGQKRFSVEGNDMLVPMLDLAIEEAAKTGGRKVVLGMAHRGRLNVLTHILGIRYSALLREFEGAPQEDGALALHVPGTGDVKYHHGAQGSYLLDDGTEVEVTLAPNPSHLEFVNPIVGGMARTLQFAGPKRSSVQEQSSVVPILMHGDAAFAAQGVVAESLNLARLRGYSVGGTVHIIVNNQVGFTTDPLDGRSTRYASDLAKGYDIPILHVNADDPEACLAAMRLAMAYRATFHDDVVIDLVGYRRYGHNEGDEPTYTQPLFYEKIADHPSVLSLWTERLVKEGAVTEDEVRTLDDEFVANIRRAQEEVREETEEGGHDPLPPPTPEPEPAKVHTAVPFEALKEVNDGTLDVPADFHIHPKLERQLKRRKNDFGPESRLDWAHAESLAFGSILKDGAPVRLSGQDSQRGTFSQRHLVLHDHQTGESIIPLREMGGARFEVYNSPLSEIAVMGYEYGYSVLSEKTLVLWEAQFGDFVNAAQVIVDQFIASGRAKWGQLSRLTLLLPHAHEGQGPEHSSARLERFLQLCAEDNMRVAYPTTPAQYFHLLRRQAIATPVRPLVTMTPKSLLRHPRATSGVDELTEGTFQPVLADFEPPGAPEDITRLILCSGKIYYDLLTHESREELRHVSLGRLEELYPFPARELEALVERYPNLEEVVWTQEEPRNMGALSYVGPRLRAVVPREVQLRHVSRPERASPAEGKTSKHNATQARIVRESLGVD